MPSPSTRGARRVTVPSLAKVNLDLRVLSKRADGYHELRTIFQTISLGDEIRIEFKPALRTKLSITGNVEIPNNLILSAAEAVLKAGRVRGEVRFHLEKRIPMGGGLGGGSSNAATVLLALPVLMGRAVAASKLHELAVELGSDVPFFLYGGTALGLGRGTEIYPLEDVPPARCLLASPGVHVSTPEAYRALDRPASSISPIAPARYFDPAQWMTEGVNDFESAVFARHPQLKRLARSLKRDGACAVRMSGSGSSVFGVFFDANTEAKALQQLKEHNVQSVTFVSRRQYHSLWWNSLKSHTLVKIWPPRSRYEQ